MAERDQPAKRVAVNDDRPTVGARPDRRELLLEIVINDAPRRNEGAPSPGRPESALVVGGDVETGRGQLRPHVLVSTGVFGESMDEQDERPRFAPRPPVANEQLRPVARRGTQRG